jgi:hypothetical protein
MRRPLPNLTTEKAVIASILAELVTPELHVTMPLHVPEQHAARQGSVRPELHASKPLHLPGAALPGCLCPDLGVTRHQATSTAAPPCRIYGSRLLQAASASVAWDVRGTCWKGGNWESVGAGGGWWREGGSCGG